MAGRRRSALTGVLVVVALGVAALALPDGATGALAARAVAWTGARTGGTPQDAARPAAAAPARKKVTRAVTGRAAQGSAARRGTASVQCSCPKKRGTARLQAAGVQGPQIVKHDNPPSVTLLPPGSGGVDRGIADTGTHADGKQYSDAYLDRYHPGSHATLTVTPSPAGTATGWVDVSWYDIGDPATVAYRVGYQAQTWVRPTAGSSSWTFPAITWVRVLPVVVPGRIPPVVAGTRTWRLTPATHGVRYTFWLEVDVTTPEDTFGSTRMLLAQQDGVLVP